MVYGHGVGVAETGKPAAVVCFLESSREELLTCAERLRHRVPSWPTKVHREAKMSTMTVSRNEGSVNPDEHGNCLHTHREKRMPRGSA